MTLNDFKSIEGDRLTGRPLAARATGHGRCGAHRLHVHAGAAGARGRAAAGLVAAAARAAAVAALIAVQRAHDVARSSPQPREQGALVQRLSACPLYVLGMMITAFAHSRDSPHERREALCAGVDRHLPAGAGADRARLDHRAGTSTMNRVMVVELALPALVPGVLVALHHVVQLLRPRLGHGSDVGGRRTPWIIGGMATLARRAVSRLRWPPRGWRRDRFAGMLLGDRWLRRNRRRRGRGGNVVARADGEARRSCPACRGCDDRVGHDDRRLHRHRRRRRASFLEPFSTERLVLVTACVAALRLRGHVARGARCRSRHARHVRPKRRCRRHRSARRCVRSGSMARRAASRCSCSYRCWPTARRT